MCGADTTGESFLLPTRNGTCPPSWAAGAGRVVWALIQQPLDAFQGFSRERASLTAGAPPRWVQPCLTASEPYHQGVVGEIEQANSDGSSLMPVYEAKNHSTYLNRLEAALSQPDVRNIALTGPYGSGKSSILAGLRKNPEFKARIVQVSLSSVGVRPTNGQEGNESDETESADSSLGEKNEPDSERDRQATALQPAGPGVTQI